MEIYYLECPHCKGLIEIHEADINCSIFRHGVYIDSGTQMNPHASREECEGAFSKGKIIGCGKPFRFIKSTEFHKVYLEICDYI